MFKTKRGKIIFLIVDLVLLILLARMTLTNTIPVSSSMTARFIP